MEHRFTACIERSGDMDAAYVVVPVDIRKEYGKGRIKVDATFDGVPYCGSVVNMGVMPKATSATSSASPKPSASRSARASATQ